MWEIPWTEEPGSLQSMGLTCEEWDTTQQLKQQKAVKLCHVYKTVFVCLLVYFVAKCDLTRVFIKSFQ